MPLKCSETIEESRKLYLKYFAKMFSYVLCWSRVAKVHTAATNCFLDLYVIRVLNQLQFRRLSSSTHCLTTLY